MKFRYAKKNLDHIGESYEECKESVGDTNILVFNHKTYEYHLLPRANLRREYTDTCDLSEVNYKIVILGTLSFTNKKKRSL